MPKRPTLLATSEQVRAFRAGATAFLVPMKPQPDAQSTIKTLVDGEFLLERWPKADRSFSNFGRCDRLNPPYAVGSVVAVKEAFIVTAISRSEVGIGFRADHPSSGDLSRTDGGYNFRTLSDDPKERESQMGWAIRHGGSDRWITALQMPSWLVRIHLTITAVAPQLVSEISEADALACGYRDDVDGFTAKCDACFTWHSRYGDKFPWAWLCRAEVKR